MFPFSVTHPRSATETGRHTANSGYELIAFDAEKLNVFAAEVRYCEPHWHPAPELITVLSGRFSIVVGQQSVEMVEGTCSISTPRRCTRCVRKRREFAGDRPVFPGLFDELHPAPVLTGVLEGAARARQTDRYSSAFATCWLN